MRVVVDLALVLVQDTVRLILHIWLMISGTCQDSDLDLTLLHASLTTTLLVLRNHLRCALANDDATGVARIRKVDRIRCNAMVGSD